MLGVLTADGSISTVSLVFLLLHFQGSATPLVFPTSAPRPLGLNRLDSEMRPCVTFGNSQFLQASVFASWKGDSNHTYTIWLSVKEALA